MTKEEIFKKGTEYANKHWDVLENPNEHDNAREDFISGAIEVVKNCYIPDLSKCACPPLVACEICGEEKNLDGDFWKNKKKHD